ncbi:hypothetical protein H8356DRAFT_1341777 [Neocallimastix lanati (nom. inval.)]|nr:hypothetical protein H8356DRAFT_1341777 [Neocallimastix sp. JGI-2020a]
MWQQITIKDYYLNSLEILSEITKMMDWENSGMSFRKTLESIKIFVTSFINMVINTKNLYKGTEFDTSRPFNEENELTYSKICEINKLEENNSIKRKIEEISRPYKKIRINTPWKKLKINKRPRNIRKHKINDNKEINKWKYVIAEYEKFNSCDNQVKSVIQIKNLKDNNNQEIERIIKINLKKTEPELRTLSDINKIIYDLNCIKQLYLYKKKSSIAILILE